MQAGVPSTEFEQGVTATLLALRCIEDAMHSKGAWTIRWGGVEVPATKHFTEEGVTFDADFPEVCYLDPVEPVATLLLDGEVRAITALDHPGDTAFAISWGLAITEPATV